MVERLGVTADERAQVRLGARSRHLLVVRAVRRHGLLAGDLHDEADAGLHAAHVVLVLEIAVHDVRLRCRLRRPQVDLTAALRREQADADRDPRFSQAERRILAEDARDRVDLEIGNGPRVPSHRLV